MAHQAQDTFVAIMGDGSDRLVTKGEVLSDNHELVKRDKSGAGTLFKPLDLGDDDERPAKSAPEAKAEAPPVAKAEAPPAPKAEAPPAPKAEAPPVTAASSAKAPGRGAASGG